MTESEKLWVGVDPGGKGNFGVAVLKPDGSVDTHRVNCADDAVKWIFNEIGTEPAGAGVDAPLWWSSGPGGGRRADQWLRDTYGLSGGEVQSSNSLRGAAIVQGVLFVERMRQVFPKIRVTESHPKALLKAIGFDWKRFSREFSIRAGKISEHERDAIISAVAAREGFEGRWTRDLSTDRYEAEQNPSEYWLKPVKYFWPG